MITPVVIGDKIIGFVNKFREWDYSIASATKPEDWSGKWEDYDEAKNYLIERWLHVGWDTIKIDE